MLRSMKSANRTEERLPRDIYSGGLSISTTSTAERKQWSLMFRDSEPCEFIRAL
jgi:hypothetical protein